MIIWIVCYPFSSGTEEEYGELSQLLEDISSYLRDIRTIQATQAEERAAQLKKCEMEKRKAEEMRYAAMERMLSEFHGLLLWMPFYVWFVFVVERKRSTTISPTSSGSTTPMIDLEDSEEEDKENEDVESEAINHSKKKKWGYNIITFWLNYNILIDCILLMQKGS